MGGGFKLYPNPSSGSVTVEFALPHPNPIVVTDLFGREIYRMNGTMDKTMVLELPNLESGIYLINFDNQQGRFGRLIQFIKQ
ncbi:MAG: T9SS type A sorting domain-containing protein [Bacteroides sp.]|nr:T9SS type A sorting domain-containing protein [Bacteroides sp.]